MQQGEFPPPRQLDPTIDRALEAVCLKAMATEARRPLRDSPAPWPTTSSGGWPTSRCRPGASPLPAPPALDAAAPHGRDRSGPGRDRAGLCAGLWLLARDGVLDRPDQLNREREAQRRRAEEREQQAIAAVKRFGDAVSKNAELKSNPKLESLRKELLKEPLSFLKALHDRLQADHDTRPESLEALASACFDLAYLTDEIGNLEDALTAYREALAIRRMLADASPSTTQRQGDLARTYNNIGVVLDRTGRFGERSRCTKRGWPFGGRSSTPIPQLTGSRLISRIPTTTSAFCSTRSVGGPTR